MHHKNHKNSTSNHSNPQHQKVPSTPSPGGASTPKKSSFLSKFRERLKERPATREEIAQLRLNTQREVLKTQMQRAKTSRPSRFGGMGGSQPRGRTGVRDVGSSDVFGGSGSWLLGPSEGPSLSFITGGGQPKGRGRRQESSGFSGKGLSDLF